MRRTVILLTCFGCGRIGFDRTSDDGAVVPIDTPPLPDSLVCLQRRIELLPVAPNSDLAIRSQDGKHQAMWAAPGSPVSVVVIADDDVAVTPIVLATGPVTGVAGIFPTSTTTLFATSTNTGNALWSTSNPGMATMTAMDTRSIARDPIVTDSTGSLRAWVRNGQEGIVVSYLDGEGGPAQERIIPTGAPVLQVAAADNDNHTHITWSQDVGGANPECVQADLDLLPIAPDIASAGNVSSDCRNPRIDSGPGAKDSILTVFETSTGSLGMRYLGAVDDLTGQLAASGRAPKVKFDGTRFWAAWLDGSVLQIAAIEEDLTLEVVELPGFTVVGDEAFELTRVGTDVQLVLLSADSISLLKTCK